MTRVTYNNSRIQTYAYNGLDQVTSESHPETGKQTNPISYIYNTENNLWQKTWGGYTIVYTYNTSNQLDLVNVGDETLDYDYDTKGRLEEVSGGGWVRDQVTYNTLGSILGERQTIPGLSAKTVSYTYDGNNNLKTVTYPDGKTLTYTNNGLNMPETLNFNGKSLVSQSAYGYGKQPASMTISGNNTSFSASYNPGGGISSAWLKKGSTYLYRAGDYGYDNVGNITSISTTVPGFDAGFIYDGLYRLMSASYSGGKSYNYTYDYYGNLETARENGTIVSDLSYDSYNRIDTPGFDYDTRGNMTEAPGFQYVWDRQNRVTSIKNSTGTVVSTHVYNERGLRLKSSRLPAPGITVLSPNGGESYYVGANADITWSTMGIVGNVKIDYSVNNGSSWTEITASTANDGHFAWTVPAEPSSDCLVRVSESDGEPSDTGDAVFTIAALPVITIIYPDGGEQFEVGFNCLITWNSSVPVAGMKVEYSTNTGGTWTTLVESTGQYSYNWTIPDEPSVSCLVRVTDNASGVFDVSDAVFTIYEPAFITITSPNGGESWETGSNHNITWTSIGPVGNVKIEYSLNNGASWTTIVSSTANDGSFPWTVPGTTSDNCRVRITDIDNYPTGTSDGVFSIVLPPAVTVTSPHGNEIWETGSFQNITWTSQGIVGEVKIEYSINSGSSWTTIIASTPNDGAHSWTIPDTPLTSAWYGSVRLTDTPRIAVTPCFLLSSRPRLPLPPPTAESCGRPVRPMTLPGPAAAPWAM